ncbi:Uma2 family endonuclease [Streptomyces sp. NPDC102467]|uniref:Uma2 family endonuclease n=1 Tax=Streptomyces sp. NPDC102467 TaxID=3366179 RepID=UPI0037FA7E0E
MTKQSTYRHLVEFRDAFDRPEPMSWPEISNGQILMVLSPKAQHQFVATKLRRLLEPQLSGDLVLMMETDVEDASLGVLRVPDLVVVEAAAEEAASDALSPRDCHLIIEVVSRSNPANDYEGKLRDYPAMGIEHYLIVDPRDGTAVHHWAPTSRTGSPTYDNEQHYIFGDTITVQDWKIDTSSLRRYEDKPEQ